MQTNGVISNFHFLTFAENTLKLQTPIKKNVLIGIGGLFVSDDIP